MTVAMDHEQTRRALRERWVRVVVYVGLGTALIGVLAMLLAAIGPEQLNLVGIFALIGCASTGPFLLGCGIGRSVANLRIRRALRRNPWREMSGDIRVNGGPQAGGTVVTLLAVASDGERVLLRIFPSSLKRLGYLSGWPAGAPVLVAVADRGDAVVSREHGDYLYLAKRPAAGSPRARRLARYAADVP